jgi:hypothetical protein
MSGGSIGFYVLSVVYGVIAGHDAIKAWRFWVGYLLLFIAYFLGVATALEHWGLL